MLLSHYSSYLKIPDIGDADSLVTRGRCIPTRLACLRLFGWLKIEMIGNGNLVGKMMNDHEVTHGFRGGDSHHSQTPFSVGAGPYWQLSPAHSCGELCTRPWANCPEEPRGLAAKTARATDLPRSWYNIWGTLSYINIDAKNHHV